MNKRSFCFAAILIAALCLPPAINGRAQPVLSSAPAQAGAGAASPAGLLNPDGTLNLDGSYSGSLTLTGWDVQLDPERGPVFSPPESEAGAPLAAAAPNHWADVGGGGGGALNGEVRAIAVHGMDAYVGGDFIDANNIEAADHVVRYNLDTGWSALGDDGSGGGSLTGGSVFALALNASGELYAGGSFNAVTNPGGGVPAARYLAKWNGSQWSAVGQGATADDPSISNGQVNALAVDGSGNLYVGGTFTDVADGPKTRPNADYIAMWDGTDWWNLGADSGGNGCLDDAVNAIVISGTKVYVGGAFLNVDPGSGPMASADYVALWDGGTWWNLGSNTLSNGSLSWDVTSLALDGSGNLYAGGLFMDVSNTGGSLPAADFIAKWTPGAPGSWSALGDNGSGEGALNNTVLAILSNGTNLYVGGTFTDVNDGGTVLPEADYIARWDGTHWNALGSNGAGDGSIGGPRVTALATGFGGLLLGGYFAGVKNSTGPVSDAANFASWDEISRFWAVGAEQGGFNGRVHAVAVNGPDVYVGGDFTNLTDNGTVIPEADYIARWDGTHWNALGSNGAHDGAVGEAVHAIAVRGATVYIGGYFNGVNNGGTMLWAAGRVARWDGTNWSALGSNGTGGSALSGGVMALALDSSGNLYAGGFFTNVKDSGTTLSAADYVAKWDGSHWSALGSGSGGNGSITSGGVIALATSGTSVYAGGYFTDVDNGGSVVDAADYIARYEAGTWYALGGTGSGGGSLNGSVRAIALSGSNVYVGGSFVNVENPGGALNNADYIAMWNGTEWSALGSGAAGQGALGSPVDAIAVNGPEVYAGGTFVNVNNSGTPLWTADHIARWNATSGWSALDGGGDGSISGPVIATVLALGIAGNQLYAGGYFWNVNDNGIELQYADYLAAWGLVSLTTKSAGTRDGWVLESSERSGAGGSLNAGASTFNLGDDGANRQYRAILSFDTSALPNAAIITSATLRIKNTGSAGANPFGSLGNILVDIKKGTFSGSAALQLSDFKAGASKNGVMSFANLAFGGWFYSSLPAAYLGYISKTGVTQFRLRFTKDDNNNHKANILKFASGNAGGASRPVLIITYSMP